LPNEKNIELTLIPIVIMKRSLQLIICISLILIFFNIEGIINVIATMTNNEGFESSILVPQRNNFLIICFAWLLIILLRKGKALFLKRYDINAEDNLEARKMYTQINLLEKIIIFIIGLFAVGFILLSFDSIKKIGYGIFASAG